jgi:hypothetical protein
MICSIASIVGLILGIVAVRKAVKRPEEYKGKGMAIAGICLNSITMVVIPIIMAAVFIPSFMMGRMAVNETTAMAQLRRMGNAELIYQRASENHGRYASLDDLIAAGLIENDAAHKGGYRYTIALADPGTRSRSRADDHSFEIYAVPDNYGTSGRRSFYLSVDQVIHAADKHGAQADSHTPTASPVPGGLPLD